MISIPKSSQLEDDAVFILKASQLFTKTIAKITYGKIPPSITKIYHIIFLNTDLFEQSDTVVSQYPREAIGKLTQEWLGVVQSVS